MCEAATVPDLQSAIARAHRLQAVLRELTGMAMDVVRALHAQVISGASSAGVEIRFCRLAAAVRRLVALEMRLAQALADVAAGRWAAEDAERELRAIADQARQDTAIETLGRAVRESGDGQAAERLERFSDWYDARAVERDFTETTVAEIVAQTCKAIGVTPDPALLAEEAMTQTLADSVRVYATALGTAPAAMTPLARRPDTWSAPPSRPPNAIAEPRPPPA